MVWCNRKQGDVAAAGILLISPIQKLIIDSFWKTGLLSVHVQLRSKKGGDPMSSGMSSAQVDFGGINDVGTRAL
jgi:hypothetical protein